MNTSAFMKHKLLFLLFLSMGIASGLSAQNDRRILVEFESGDVVASVTGRLDGPLTHSDRAYAEDMVGIYSTTTAISNIPSFITSGIAFVKFDASNGTVVKGDWITSSSLPGHAMKAKEPGTMLGVALENSVDAKGLLRIRVQVGWYAPKGK